EPRQTSERRHLRIKSNCKMYPLIEAFYSGHMTVSELHEIYYEQCGNKNGIPVVFVHDGPGAGICIDDRRYFDPSAYHIILFDQRGAGKSIPAYTLEDNDTWSLVSDMERLRKFLGVSRWIVFGVGWGSGLSLAYAEKYTSCVLALVLCGIFTMRDEEIKWYHQEGASHLFPDSWDKYLAPIPEDERGNLIAAYYKRLTGYNEEQQQLCAKGWSRWTMSTKSLKEDIFMPFSKQRVWALHMATLESHYYINKCFVAPNQILNNADEPRKTSTKRRSRTRTNGTLYPPIEPFHSGYLKVSEIHQIYFEQCGNKNGIPILYVHGGPGTGIYPKDRRYFDPKAYHIILFDQRGAGKSIPAFSLEDNDTWSLVRDMEKLRKILGVSRWILFGGSWGSALSLAYAEKHTNRILGLILRGIFTVRDEEIQWFLQNGASHIFPDYWEQFVAPIPEDERDNLIAAYYKRLTGNNEEEKLRCAKAWSNWEMATSRLKVNAFNLARSEKNIWALAFARIECHYYINKGFMAPNQLLKDAHIIRKAKIPVTIVQGRYDVVCPADTAWELHKKLPEADFFFIDDAGHSAKEDGIKKKLVETCDTLAIGYYKLQDKNLSVLPKDSSMNLQICFMNETASDNESPSSDSESCPKLSKTFSNNSTGNSYSRYNSSDSSHPYNTRPLSVNVRKGNTTEKASRPSSLPIGPKIGDDSTKEVDFFTKQARLQIEARMALAQAKDMAHMQMEIDRQKQKQSPITEIIRNSLEKVGITFPEEKRRVSRLMLTDMNIAQLQVIVNEFHTQIERLNENLVQFLMERDDLHMSQDSMLVDIEDLTRYLLAKEQTTDKQNNQPAILTTPTQEIITKNPLVKPTNRSQTQ
ncbi:putative proline iminopeptidase, partial [Pseudolycoriella hygida]